MELSYFANSQEMGLAGNLLYPNDTVSNQNFYYEYNADYLYAKKLSGTTITQSSNLYGIGAANQFDTTSSNRQVGPHLPIIYSDNFQSNSIEDVPFESSVFLSPQTSASSSAAHSPQVEIQSNENDGVFDDLSLEEIFNVDDILNNSDFISAELLDVLNDVGSNDYLSQLEHQPLESSPSNFIQHQHFDSGSSFTSDSSVTCTPKRKYSTDSSDCSSQDSFETCSTVSSITTSKKTNNKRARKKHQNKMAASRYRNKKKTEMTESEQTLEELEIHRDNLNEQVKKLQTEFNVILPLAMAAFDPIRKEHLNQLISRINTLL